ncbi:MAG: regulatory protein RecX [Lachnospiraceae bacterium]|nr:regulatory protein RecX [Lachnospiraceae bacterium]
MTVTKLLSLSKNRIRVYIDEEPAFILYPQDIRTYDVTEGEPLSEDIYAVICKEVLLRRAKKKAMDILIRSDKTESDIREKLSRMEYPTHIIDSVIDFLYSYHYLDDKRFADNYIQANSSSRSKVDMKRQLRKHGIGDDITSDLFQEHGIEDTETLSYLMDKKLSGKPSPDPKELRRIVSYFMRRGFSFSDVERELRKRNIELNLYDIR